MGYLRRVPAPPLDTLVEAIWDWDMPPAAGHRFERVLPVPGSNLIINLHEDSTRVYADDGTRRCRRASGSVIGGPCRHSWIIDTIEQIRVMGVNFRPGGAHALTGLAAEEFGQGDIDLEDLYGADTRLLRERLLHAPGPHRRLAVLEGWLRRRVRESSRHPLVAHATAVLDRCPQAVRIGDLRRELDCSATRLGALFRRHVGMTPKRYARLMRFRAVVACAWPQKSVDWSRIAADGGFSDQAHLNHEFRAFAGVTPGAFMASRGPYPNHLPLDWTP